MTGRAQIARITLTLIGALQEKTTANQRRGCRFWL